MSRLSRLCTQRTSLLRWNQLATVDVYLRGSSTLCSTSSPCSYHTFARQSPSTETTDAFLTTLLGRGDWSKVHLAGRFCSNHTDGNNVELVDTLEKWREHINDTKNGKVAMIDFYAIWCGPCRMMSPVFEKYSSEYPNIKFLKVDIQQLDTVASECGVQAVPAFQIWKDGKMVEQVVGASKEALKGMCEKYNP